MQCEICGRDSELKKAEIDGTELMLCSSCNPEKSVPATEKKSFAFTGKKISAPNPGNLGEGLEVASDYGKRIREAREKKELTLEELSKKLFQNKSFIQRIEAQSIVPSNELIKKIESELEINLKEKNESEIELNESNETQGRTLADFIKKKK